jgi:Sulfotransferase family
MENSKTLENLMVDRPIFLVGAERSGTTLLRLMLSQHPQIAWCAEFEYAVDQISEIGDYPELSDYYDWLSLHRIFQDMNYQIDPQLDYVELIHSFLKQESDRHHKPIVGATVHRHYDRLLSMWQSARFIHIVRDPRDVAYSCMGMGWAGNVWAGVRLWIEAEELWNDVEQKIPPEHRIEVRYEALILKPEETLAQLCRFIGVSYSAKMMHYPETTTYSAPNPKLIHQWQKKMTDWEIRLVESRAAVLMEQRGYELSRLPQMNTKLYELSLRLQDWWRRKQFRAKRYGWSLLIADFLSRRLGFHHWQRDVRLQLNDIERIYLK